MEIGVVTTKKPWTMLVFVLVAINAIVALTVLMNIKTPIDQLASQPLSMLVPIYPTATAQATPGTTTLNLGATLLLILNALALYGLYKGHVWSWWLLTLMTLISVVVAVVGVVQGAALATLPFILNLVLVAALLKKEVVQTYEPKLNILPKDGVW